MSSIRFENVKKSFRDVTVIKELNLTVADGEFFTFVGPSGCGKSTILNMIAGLEDVTEGLILFDGTAVNHLSPKDRDVAMVFQSYALYPHMNVFDNIAFPLRMRKLDRSMIEDEVKRVAALLGLEDLLGRKPKELSGGQRQRVALGRAIIRKPKVFLMDEPLSNLDARLRIETRAELKKLHQELKITTVYVTHDQAEAMSLSDRVAVIDQGQIQQCDSPVEVYSRPANIFVAGFIGSPPMNFIPASLRKQDPPEIDCNGFILSPALENVRREKLIIGIRPEDVIVSAGKADNESEVDVSVVEPAGAFNWVDFTWNKVKMKGMAKVETQLLSGGRAFMKFPPEKIIVFDAKSGERLQ